MTKSNKNTWYKLKASAEGVKLFIYGYIGEWEISADTMLRELMQHDGKDLTLHLHTYGGEVDEGVAIFAALKDYKGEITGVVDSVCASISSLILAACDKRYIRPQARIMIHQCHGWAQGTAADFRARADEAEIINEQMMQAFADATGQPLEKIIEDTKDSDYWMGAQAAVDYGFCHGIYDGETTALEASISADVSGVPAANTVEFRKMQALRAAIDADAIPPEPEGSSEPEGDHIAGTNQPEPETSHSPQLTAEKDDMTPEEFKQQEQQRKAGIKQLFAKHPKAKKLKAQCLDDMDCDIDTARIKLLAYLEPQDDNTNNNEPQSPAPAGNGQTALTANAAKAHLANYFGAKLKACKMDESNPYRNMRAAEALRAHAMNLGDVETAQLGNRKLVASAFNNSTHSLGIILETNINALILDEQAKFKKWHDSIVERQPMRFGTNDILDAKDLGKPGNKTEGGSFTQVTLKATGQKAVLSTLGYDIKVTRELIMEDKFDFINKQIAKAVKNCAQVPADALVELLKNNPKLEDNKTLFGAHRSNEFTEEMGAAALAKMSGAMADTLTSKGNALGLVPDLFLTSNTRKTKVNGLLKSETIDNKPNEAFEAFERAEGLAELSKDNVAFAFANKEHVSIVEGYHEDAEGVQIETRDQWKSDGATVRVYIDSAMKIVDGRGIQKLNITVPAQA